jgi:uncharacterized OsmC-like protein
VLVGLGGCFTSHLLAAVAARNATVSGVSVSVSGTLDGTPERFTAFELVVTAAAGNRDTLEQLVALAERSCQVIATLRLAAPVVVKVAAGSQHTV